MEPPKVILGFDLDEDGKIVVIVPGTMDRHMVPEDELAEFVRKSMAKGELPGVTIEKNDDSPSKQKIEEAFANLVGFSRDVAADQFGETLVNSGATLVKAAHSRAKGFSRKGGSAWMRMRKRRAGAEGGQ